jgi:cytochrome oxidase Cu insertion factor (SCO1/SenC/PrrC family)
MTRVRRLALGVAALGLLAGALWLGLGAVPSAQAKVLDDLMMDLNITPVDAQTPAAFTVTTLDGDRLTLADVKGRAVLVYFWATW